jgi:hypothetical protein
MDFRITSADVGPHKRRAAFTLIELLFTVGITGLCLACLSVFFVFSTHSFATLFNYVDLDDANRIAMDQLTRDVRQSNCVTAYTTNSLTLQDSDGLPLSYTYDPTGKTLTRTKNGVSKQLLQECNRLAFVLGQRTPVGGSYDVYPAATPATAKVINVSWSCSRKVFGIQEDTESVQTARIVIRKQGS